MTIVADPLAVLPSPPLTLAKASGSTECWTGRANGKSGDGHK
jgi:hypothetical protein